MKESVGKGGVCVGTNGVCFGAGTSGAGRQLVFKSIPPLGAPGTVAATSNKRSLSGSGADISSKRSRSESGSGSTSSRSSKKLSVDILQQLLPPQPPHSDSVLMNLLVSGCDVSAGYICLGANRNSSKVAGKVQ